MLYLTQGIHRALQNGPQRPATMFGDRIRSWQAFADRIARLGSALRLLGVQPGDRVSMLAVNSDRYIEYYYATLWAGAVVVPVNTRWSLPEIVACLKDAGSSVLIFDNVYREHAATIRDATPVAHLIHADEGETPAGALAYERLIATSEPMLDACRHGDAMAAIMYTGGTTGEPKGVMLSHQGVMMNCIASSSALGLTEDKVLLHSAPLFHMAAGWTMFGATLQGAAHAVLPSFSPAGVLAAVKSYGATHLLLVPTMVRMLMDEYDAAGGDLSSLETLAYGASPMSEGLLRRVIAALPGVRLINAYGQTELSPAATLLLPEHHVLEGAGSRRLRSVGRPISCIDLKVVDSTGRACSPGEVGEIWVRGPTTMLGYWNKPEVSAATKVDGWVHTGDAGYLDGDGFLFLVDRVKDMIISGGENVYSAEVENALALHEAVGDCAVFGVPDEKWGERVHALVIPRAGHTIEAEALQAHCRALIANYKCPRSIEVRLEPFPLSGAGKVLKTELRAPYWSGHSGRVS